MSFTHLDSITRVLKVCFGLILGLQSSAVLAQVKPAESFSLSGQLPRSLKGKVYLLDQTNRPVYCSTIVGNRFMIKGSLPEPGLYQLKVDTASLTYPILIEGSAMKVTLQEDNTYQVKGSKLHDQWEQYNVGFLDLIRNELIRNSKERSIAGQKGDTVLVNKLQKQNDSVSVYYGNRQREYITQKPYSYFNLFLLQDAGMGDEYIADRLDEYRSSLGSYRTFQRLEQELTKRFEQQQKVGIGREAYNFTLPDSTGTTHSLDSMRKKKKLILVDFWASWCGPCIKEFPHLKALHEEFAKQGLEIIGISSDSNAKQWLRALSRLTPTGLQLHVTDQNPVMNNYAIYSIPQTFLIDQKGVIRAHNLRGDDLNKKVAELLVETR